MIKLSFKNQTIFENATGNKLLEFQSSLLKSDINPFILDDTIQSEHLNRLGLQVFRWLAYDQQMESLRLKSPLFNSDDHKQLLNNGYIKINNVFEKNKIKKIQKEILLLPETLLTKKVCKNLPITVDISLNKKVQNIFRLCQGDQSYIENNLYLRKISHLIPGEYSENARQYNFHVDKFYPNFKVWFYPFEIKRSSGPLAFFRGSHKNTVEKMQWVYNNSVNNKNWSRLHNNISDYKKVAESLQLKDETVCEAQNNTMYIVDTRMFHRRTPADIGKLRLSFRAILKRNNLF